MTIRARVVTISAVFGFLGVGFGAFAEHGLTDPLAQGWMRTGSVYQLIHALAAVTAVLLPRPAPRAATAFLVGALLFSGSLYAMALGAPHMLGAVTPLGGLGFLIGWVLLALAARRQPD